jgi:MFS family permease
MPQRDQTQLGLVVLAGTAFLLSTDLTMVNVAIGAIQSDLQASMTQLGWVVDSYAIAMVSLLLWAAPLGQRLGQKRVFLLGLGLFGLGSLLGALAAQISLLIAARVVMGVGAALMLAPSQVLTAVLFPPDQRTAAFATWSTLGALGLCVGPLLGGLLVSGPGWAWIFSVNLPVVALALVVGWRVLPGVGAQPDTALDPFSLASSGLGLVLSLGAVLQGPDQGWRSPAIAGSLLGGLPLLGLFVQRQRQLAQPLLQPAAWHQPSVRRALVALFAMTLSFNGAQFLAVMELDQAGWTPLAIGLLLAPYALVVWLTSRRATTLIRRLGALRLISLAYLPLVLSFVLLGLAPASGALAAAVGLGLVLGGLGQGVIAPVATTLAYNNLPAALLGSGAGLAMLARFLGSSVIVAVLDSALASGSRSWIPGLLGAGLVSLCWLVQSPAATAPAAPAAAKPCHDHCRSRT